MSCLFPSLLFLFLPAPPPLDHLPAVSAHHLTCECHLTVRLRRIRSDFGAWDALEDDDPPTRAHSRYDQGSAFRSSYPHCRAFGVVVTTEAATGHALPSLRYLLCCLLL